MRILTSRVYALVAGSFVLISCSLLASRTWAGLRRTEPVIINTAGRYAQGSLGSARDAADGNQSIGCVIRESGLVSCSARSASNTVLSCGSNDPLYRAAAQSLNGDSRLYFSADAAGNCTSLVVENYSFWLPKPP